MVKYNILFPKFNRAVLRLNCSLNSCTQCTKSLTEMQKQNDAVCFEIHLNLVEPLQHRWTLLQWEGWVRGGLQTATRSQSLHSTAVQYSPENCSTFITAADVQEAAWLVAHAHRVKVLAEAAVQKSTSYVATVLIKTSETPAPLLSGTPKNESMILKLTWSRQLDANIFIQLGWDFTEKMMTMNNLQPLHCEIRVQRESLHCGSNFSAGGIIKTVPLLDFPYGSVALISNCFSIKFKTLQHASATVNNPAAWKLKDCQSIIPLVKNFTRGPTLALFVFCDY